MWTIPSEVATAIIPKLCTSIFYKARRISVCRHRIDWGNKESNKAPRRKDVRKYK